MSACLVIEEVLLVPVEKMVGTSIHVVQVRKYTTQYNINDSVFKYFFLSIYFCLYMHTFNILVEHVKLINSQSMPNIENNSSDLNH